MIISYYDIMATVLEKKNGGPYSKKDQEARRIQVHVLYFEKGYSAVKIAQKLDEVCWKVDCQP